MGSHSFAHCAHTVSLCHVAHPDFHIVSVWPVAYLFLLLTTSLRSQVFYLKVIYNQNKFFIFGHPGILL